MHALATAGGPRLTGVLVVIALVALGNVVTGAGARLLEGHHGPSGWLGPAVQISLAVTSSAWALVRVGTHWGADQPATPVAAPGWAHAVADAQAHTLRPRWWRVARWALSIIALLAAGLVLARQWPALQAGLLDLRRVRTDWIRVAVYAEALSLVAFAYVQRQLLRAGGISLGLGSMVEISVAGNALRVSLPGGAAWSASFNFDQFRRRGANRVLAVYVVVVAWLMSTLALIVLFIGSVYAGGPTGLGAKLRVIAVLLTAGVVGTAVITVFLRRSPAATTLARRGLVWMGQLPWLGAPLRSLQRRIDPRTSGVRYSTWLYTSAFGYAMFNWVTDCTCLVACVVGVTGQVPWRGVVILYVLAQLGATLPLTPGGLGVVEATLTLGLVSYGVPTAGALAAVLLYRVVSFWALIPIGWAMWGALTLGERRGSIRAAWTSHARRH